MWIKQCNLTDCVYCMLWITHVPSNVVLQQVDSNDEQFNSKFNIEGPQVLKREVKNAIKQIKHGKTLESGKCHNWSNQHLRRMWGTVIAPPRHFMVLAKYGIKILWNNNNLLT